MVDSSWMMVDGGRFARLRLWFLVALLSTINHQLSTAWSQSNITASVTVTNALGITNGHSLTIGATTWLVTNSSLKASYIHPTNSAPAAATNIYNKISLALTNRYLFTRVNTTNWTIRTRSVSDDLSISLSSGWGILSLTTNAAGGASLGASNLVAQSISLGGVTRTTWPAGGSGGATVSSNDNTILVTSNAGPVFSLSVNPHLSLTSLTASTGIVTELNMPAAGHMQMPGTVRNTNVLLVLDAVVPDLGFSFFASDGILQQSKYGGYLHSLNLNSNPVIQAVISVSNAASYAQTVTDNAALSNIVVSFTITTNLSYTNFLMAAAASNVYFNVMYSWTDGRFLSANGQKFITNSGAGFILGSSVSPNKPTAFTNDTLIGQYDTNGLQSTPPYVYYPSNAVIETNWFIAGRSQKIPLASINAEDFGVRGDAIKLYAATVDAGALICTNAAFTSNDVGKSVVIYTTSTNTDYVLTKIVAFNNSTNVPLGTNFTQSTAYEAWYFTDNFVAHTNALGSFSGDGVMNYTGQYGTLYGFATSAIDSTSGRYAVINIPTDRSTGIITNMARTIVLRGQTPAMVYPQSINAGGTTTIGSPNSGTILFNFAKPVSGATNVFVYHDGTGVGGSQFARECVLWENITWRQPGRPTHYGLYLGRSGTSYLRNWNLDVDKSANWLNATSGIPPFYMEGIVSNANTVFGVYGADPYNYAGIILENTTVGYHGTAYRLGEHTVGIGKTIAVACGQALYQDGAFGAQGTYNGSTFAFFYPYLCQYRIGIATNSTAREPLTIGNLCVEEGFPRPDIGPMIYDPLKRGDINIQAITGNAQNTTIESTNGSWNNTILNFSYNRGVIHSNGTVFATSFTGSGSGLYGISTNGVTNLGSFVGGAVMAGIGSKLAATNAIGVVPFEIRDTNNLTVLQLDTADYAFSIFHTNGNDEVFNVNRVTGVTTGNAGGMTNLNASELTSGTVPSNALAGVVIPKATLVGPATNVSGIYGSGSTNSGYLLTQTTNLNVTGTTTIPAAIRSSSAALALVGYYLSSTAIKGYLGAYTGGLMFLGDDGASTNMTIAVTTGIITTRSNINSGGTITANNGFISPPLVCTTATTNWSGQGIISTATNTTIFVSITGQEGKRFTAARTVLNTAAGGQAILYCTNGSFFSHGSGTFATNVTVPISSVLTYYCVGTNFIAE